MATKKSKKDTKKKKLAKGAPSTNVPGMSKAEEANEPFDYGGLPDRSLKKNLGCG